VKTIKKINSLGHLKHHLGLLRAIKFKNFRSTKWDHRMAV
jgi:hypothetical protein